MSVSQAKFNEKSQNKGGVCPVCGSTEFLEKNGLETCAFCGAVAKGGVGDATEKFIPLCPFCGGNDFDADEDVFICRHCGESYFIDDLKGRGNCASNDEYGGKKTGNAEDEDKTVSVDGVTVSGKSRTIFYAPPESLAERIKNSKMEKESDRFAEQRNNGDNAGVNEKKGVGVIRNLRNGDKMGDNSKENGESLTLGFLDAVSRLNETAYDLVDGNANVWARTAYDKNIIGREEKSEVGRIVAKRNRIAHGFGGKVRASKQDVDGAKKYYDVMIKTKNRIV